MASNINTISGKPRAVGERVLVTDLYFGEQTTESGIVITSDNGKERGIYPRWAKVYSKGPRNKDPYEVGDWILIEHGRWTRGIKIDDGNGEITIHMIDQEGILAHSDEKPSGITIGNTTENGQGVDIRPEDFMR
jgi:co-chaperonin GroES (HSP10)